MGSGPLRRPGRYGDGAAGSGWSTNLDRASRWFDRYGPRAVLTGRVLPVVRTFISLPADIAGLEPARFGTDTTIGCIPWTAALAYAGYAVGANWRSIVNGFRGPTYIVAALAVIALAVAVWRYARRRKGPVCAGRRPAARRRWPAARPRVSAVRPRALGSCHLHDSRICLTR